MTDFKNETLKRLNRFALNYFAIQESLRQLCVLATLREWFYFLREDAFENSR